MADTYKMQLLQKRNFSEVVGDTFGFIRLNLAILLKVHFLLSLPIVILTAGIFVLLFREHFSLVNTISSGVFQDSIARREEMTTFIVARFFTIMAVMPVSIHTLIVLDRYMVSPDGTVKFEDVWAMTRRKYLPLLGAKLIMLPVMLFAGLFLALPGIAIYTIFLCVEMLMLQHGFGIFKAIKRSQEIMTKNFGMAFLFSFSFLLVYVIFIGMMQLPVMLLESVTDMTTAYFDPNNWWSILSMSLRTFNTVLSFVIYTIPSVGVGILYFSIRERSSQSNMVERIRNIGLPKQNQRAFSLGDEQY